MSCAVVAGECWNEISLSPVSPHVAARVALTLECHLVTIRHWLQNSRGVMPTHVRDKLAEIASATVSDLSGASIAFSSLYQGGGAVVMLVRRLG